MMGISLDSLCFVNLPLQLILGLEVGILFLFGSVLSSTILISRGSLPVSGPSLFAVTCCGLVQKKEALAIAYLR